MNKILVANRGEIAVRIMQTAQSLGYETVAVFSDADADAPHVALADQAVLLGAADVAASYLNTERILDAARRTGADAVHPGYGFLSENADFAQAVLDLGLTWIGPPPSAMHIMGNKAEAKRVLADTAVPTVPGYASDDQSDDAFVQAANSIGFPVMVKAAAGGGGRGMRLVVDAAALPAALASARSEAEKAFGSPELLLEKAIVNPRHIEVQVFGDTHGSVIHLGERDCSIQRRHQKVVEEAPSTAVSPQLRAQIGQAAVAAAKAVGYVGAGTVEFLLDEAGDFYFIEMNTRLQVEHPVTELITGQDLVAWQLAVAEGAPLPLTQEQVQLNGHAIEVRLYAEDPNNQFLPSTGTVHLWQPPAGDGVRVDAGLTSGTVITPFYDAMVAKIITHGATREIARRRLMRALRQTAVFGVTTNRQFLLETAVHPTFVAGEATTQFIDKMERLDEAVSTADAAPLAALLFALRGRGGAGWQSRPFSVRFDEQVWTVTTNLHSDFAVINRTTAHQIKVVGKDSNAIWFEVDGVRETAVYAFTPDNTLWLQLDEATHTFADTLLAPPEPKDAASNGKIIAPMPGSVMRIDVAEGDSVTKGQTLLILEAMKMEHAITAPFDGEVTQILVDLGQQMQPKELMIVIGGRNAQL